MAEQAAKVTVTGTAKNPVFNIDIPTGAKGERGIQGIQGPIGQTPQPVVGEVITTPNPADDIWMADIVRNSPSVSAAFKEIFPTSMQGVKGDKGGWDNGTSLNSLDLNTITTPGIYHQWNTNLGNKTLNYPLNGIAGTLHVSRWSGSEGAVLQEFVVLGSGGVETAAQRPRVLAHRYFGNKWSDWSIVAPHRVDNTAGRVIYTWDETANRDQLVHGDTGWRDVSGDSAFVLQNGWKAQSVHVRRIGSTLHYLFRVLDGTAATGVVIMTPPAGFRVTSAIPAYLSHPVIISDTAIRNIAIQGMSGTMQSLTGWTTGDRIVPILSTTMDTWPTSLPGTAVGIIPNL